MWEEAKRIQISTTEIMTKINSTLIFLNNFKSEIFIVNVLDQVGKYLTKSATLRCIFPCIYQPWSIAVNCECRYCKKKKKTTRKAISGPHTELSWRSQEELPKITAWNTFPIGEGVLWTRHQPKQALLICKACTMKMNSMMWNGKCFHYMSETLLLLYHHHNTFTCMWSMLAIIFTMQINHFVYVWLVEKVIMQCVMWCTGELQSNTCRIIWIQFKFNQICKFLTPFFFFLNQS